MVHSTTSFKKQNFPLFTTDANSDNRYRLRKMLVRGVSEAYYRYWLHEGDKAFDFKRLAFKFENIIDDLDSMLDDKGRIRGEHRTTIIRSIKDCQYLLALDHAEMSSDYRNLMAYLTHDLCLECQRAMVVD